jgi:hypothetical protein
MFMISTLASSASRLMAAGALTDRPFMAGFAIGSAPGWSRLIADDTIERSELFVGGSFDGKTPLAKACDRGPGGVRQPARRFDQ